MLAPFNYQWAGCTALQKKTNYLTLTIQELLHKVHFCTSDIIINRKEIQYFWPRYFNSSSLLSCRLKQWKKLCLRLVGRHHKIPFQLPSNFVFLHFLGRKKFRAPGRLNYQWVTIDWIKPLRVGFHWLCYKLIKGVFCNLYLNYNNHENSIETYNNVSYHEKKKGNPVVS